MDKFWKWVEEKYKLSSTNENFIYVKNIHENLIPIKATKQMLIGYMYEYLMVHNIFIFPSEPIKSIAGLYAYLVDAIEKKKL